MFLVLIFVNQGFKYCINVYRGLTGERMLRRLRYDLYSRVLRFPQPTFRKLSQGEITTMINTEVEPLGGFIGDAFSLPAFQGGTLIVILGFVLVQNAWLALAAVMFYPFQFWIIPKLQFRVNMMAKKRVRLVRSLSDRIGETVSGVSEIHAHNTAGLELARFSNRLGEIFETRFQIYLWKFIIKFINNSINHLGPFFFYSVGGWLVIQGRLEIGTLVAVLAANKDLAAPWKELLNYYQRREDARIKYEQVIEQFQPPDMLDDDLQHGEPDDIPPLSGDFAAATLTLEDDTGNMLVDGASFKIATDEHIALVGPGGSGKDQIVMMLARLVAPGSGTLTLNDANVAELPEAVTGRRMAYVGTQGHLFSTSVRENLLYGLMHRPLKLPDYDQATATTRNKWVAEAELAGNSTADLEADWVDYEAAGVADAAELNKRIIEVLSMVDMENDIREIGLRGTIDPNARPELAKRILEARAAFHDRLSDPEVASLVEVFDGERYNDNATLAENLLFGSPVGDAFDIERLSGNAYVLEVLETAELTDELLNIGRQVASTMVELFADLPPGHEFFERFSFISHDDLPEYQALLTRLGNEGLPDDLKEEEHAMLLSLSFKLAPARHRLDMIDDTLREKVLRARRNFADNLPAELKGAIEPLDSRSYNASLSIQDNILFGKVSYGHAQGTELVGTEIAQVVDKLGLTDVVMEVGLNFQVGIAGSRLSPNQRQKLAIARSVLKRPDVLILNEATASLDIAAQTKILGTLLEEFKGRGLIWALHRASFADRFDRVLVMRAGRVVEEGGFEELESREGTLKELIAAE
jgi:ABC-type multidrug transport system fused ATPase/permease subunit